MLRAGLMRAKWDRYRFRRLDGGGGGFTKGAVKLEDKRLKCRYRHGTLGGFQFVCGISKWGKFTSDNNSQSVTLD